MLCIFLLLWLLTIGVNPPLPPEDEGIEVAFGDAPDGGGYEAVQSEETPAEETTSAPTPAAADASPAPAEPVLTQEEEEAIAMAEQQKREAAERAERKRIEKQKRLEAKRQKEAEAAAKANALGSRFGNSGDQGSGQGSGNSRLGSATGHGNVGGASWSLSGRSVKALPEPSRDFENAGTVVVQIQVDATGHVTRASIAEGGNTADPVLQRLALAAARKAEFNESEEAKQIGTITYHFKQKQ